ncbi:hypothetical protein [Edwardsiella tarda]|uniref:hypothetical protein n=1 Tax=Edwardsiella tarda TaxID=636 RepID=UPI003F658F99
MIKKASYVGLLCLTALLSGCNDKGADFIGNWHYGNDYKETNIAITKDKSDNLYQITISDKDIDMGGKEFKPSMTMKGEAISDDALKIIGPASSMVPELNIKDGKLTMPNGNTYDKVK